MQSKVVFPYEILYEIGLLIKFYVESVDITYLIDQLDHHHLNQYQNNTF
jgi:hypothetical protein